MTRFLLLCVALATVSSASAIVPGEFPIAPLPAGFAPHDRQNVKVAANELLAFAAWEDDRVVPGQPRIWGQRVRVSTGELLDPTGISIAKLATTPRSRLVAVGTDGADFLVAWTDGDRLKLAKVTTVGAVIPLPELSPNISVDHVSINWAGDSYAIFFTDPAPPPFFPPAINIFLLRTDGTIRAPATVVLRSEGVASFESASANVGESLFVAWSDIADGAVHAMSFGTFQLRDSTLVAAPPVPPVFQPGQPPLSVSMATNGIDVFAAWFEPDNGDYRVQRFNGSGFPFGPPAIVAPAPAELTDTALTWDGVQYVVFFKAEDDSLQTVRYAADGTRSDVTPLFLAAPVVVDVSAATSLTLPDFSFVAWTGDDGDDTGEQVFADFLTRTGVFGPPPGELTLSVSFADRLDVAAVWVGPHYLAAWLDATNFTRAAIGRFTVDGQPLDGTGIIVSSGDVAAPPVLATNGSSAVVAWRDTDGVGAAIVNGASVLPLFEGFAGGVPSVNWNGQQYVVVWRSPQGQLQGLRISGSGVIDQLPVTIAPITGQPIIGWTGTSYVVAFREPEGCFTPCNPSILWAQLVSPALTAIGSRIQLSETLAGLPVIAGGPSGALVVWPRTVGTTTTLRGARVVNGAVIDPLNGFEIGAATYATVYAGPKSWGVVSGPFQWSVSVNGTVSPRTTLFPFVPLGAPSLVVLGGPEPLVVYRREPMGPEQMMQSVARFFITKRDRAVRH